MSGMSSHVMWNEIFNPDAELTLAKALAAQRSTADELASQQRDPKSATIGGVRDYMTSFSGTGFGVMELAAAQSQFADRRAGRGGVVAPHRRPGDRFPRGDHWVRVDFMRRLGLNYPS